SARAGRRNVDLPRLSGADAAEAPDERDLGRDLALVLRRELRRLEDERVLDDQHDELALLTVGRDERDVVDVRVARDGSAGDLRERAGLRDEIGRASCRESEYGSE